MTLPVLDQSPRPGERFVFFRGDTAEFTLKLDRPAKGRAFLRSTLGHAAIRRQEIIDQVTLNKPLSGQDWHDKRMEKVDDLTYVIKVALTEVGHFAAKCCFFPEGGQEPLWPGPDNTYLNVGPAEYCCANSLYCAFVRQFGPTMTAAKTPPLPGLREGQAEELDRLGYTLIPPSGTFRDMIKHLDFIVHTLKCRIIHLLPINPTPTVYGRMGRYGSPYAALDFTAVDPSLAVFDTTSTPLDQFCELVDHIHCRRAKLIIDIAINHTGWAAKLHETHPEWFVRDANGAFVSPGAWGTIWGDLSELNKDRLDLWKYLADVFLVWCERGVDGFRCDAGYMIPTRAWEFIVARVRQEYPDTIFFLEGLGGSVDTTRDLLNRANMNWAYSELFQNYERPDIERYLLSSSAISRSDGVLAHYAETHDNNRLAAVSPRYAKTRASLCALASSNGAFGFTNGVEWFATEKVDVHEARSLNWGNPENMVAHLARLNAISLVCLPFHQRHELKILDSHHPKVVVFVRGDANATCFLLVLINLDYEKPATARWEVREHPFLKGDAIDLLTGETLSFYPLHGEYTLTLEPGQARCLTADAALLGRVIAAEKDPYPHSDQVTFQRAKAMALDMLCHKNNSQIVSDVNPDALAVTLMNEPERFLETLFGTNGPIPYVRWHWPEDIRREVPLPPGHGLFITAAERFRVTLRDATAVLLRGDALSDNTGRFFCFLPPLPPPDRLVGLTLKIQVHAQNRPLRQEGRLTALPIKELTIDPLLANAEIRAFGGTFLATNGRGAMCRPSVKWGETFDRYDCLLAANLSPVRPENRRVFWTRCRAWALHHGRSVELCLNTTRDFHVTAAGAGVWGFHIPVGKGLFVDLTLVVDMPEGKNAARLYFMRKAASGKRNYLDDGESIRLILRPDIEDRDFHALTKAYQGPEQRFPAAIATASNGFRFRSETGATFVMTSSRGHFHREDEWRYNVHRPLEADRGLEADGDLFSPGYYDIELWGDEKVELIGQVLSDDTAAALPFRKIVDTAAIHKADSGALEKRLLRAMKAFVVNRDGLKTVIAGYPWFLDWGRDTLICARGMVAAGMFADTAAILKRFAGFVENGTMPNMISGEDASNRDTSDAPLWLFSACSDLIRATDDATVLSERVKGSRSLLDALMEIAEGYLKGTPNGVKVDPASMLVYSPSHFTWMDTNYPACTPRQGYPIEIQALWFAAVDFLFERTKDAKWADIRETVRASIQKYFRLRGREYLSDCLRLDAFAPPATAVADDHLRPNQLFAITLGAIRNFEIAKGVLNAAACLLVPGALRSLADRPVDYALPLWGNHNNPLNDPNRPYFGHYEGDEDTRRKPAYHNGTAWTWLFPSYCEAYYLTYGALGRQTAASLLISGSALLKPGCVGHLPEILDGDYPHWQRGCDAQAWSVTEFYRVWKRLNA